ncbi:MAG: PAS domain S-box protein, partial [Chloroflexi bacterium]|nr:PAS domain S-box protein [Chloroflexota bacterium]
LPAEQVVAERQKTKDDGQNVIVIKQRLASGAERTVEELSSNLVWQGKPVLFLIMHDISGSTHQPSTNLELVLQEEVRRHEIVLEDLRIHQIELEMQNVELRRTQAALDAERARYFDLYDLAPVGYCTISTEDVVTETNLTTVSLLEVTRVGILKKPFHRFIHPDQQPAYLLARRRLFETGKPLSLDVQLLKKDGTHFWAHLEATIRPDALENSKKGADRPIAAWIVISDISERKRAEQVQWENQELAFQNKEKAKRAAELTIANQELVFQNEEKAKRAAELVIANAYLENLINYANAAIIVWDPKHCITRFNHTFEILTGRIEADVLGQSLQILFPPALVDETMAQIERTSIGERGESVEIKILHRDASVRTLLWNSARLYEPDGKTMLATIAQGLDITERKRAEEALADTQLQMGSIIESTRAGTWIWNIQSGEMIFNEQWAQNTGYSLAELIPISIKTWEMLVHPDDLLRSDELLERHFTGELPYYDCELRMKHKDGHWVWIQDRGRVFTHSDDGKPLLMFGTETDISERKQVEEALLQSEERYRAVVEWAPYSIVVHRDGKIIYVNPAAIKFFGANSAQDLVGNLIYDRIHPSFHKTVQARLKKLVDEGVGAPLAELQYLRLDGSIVVAEAQGIPILYDGLPAIYAVLADISARKQAEEARAQTAARLSLAVRTGGVGTWEYDILKDRLIWDDQMYRLYGITSQDFSGAYDAWQHGLHPQDRERGDNEIQAAWRGEKEFDTEFRVVWPDGSVHDIRALALVQRDQAGKPLSMLGTNWEITAQKLAEEALRYAHWKLESTIEGTQAGTWEWNVQTGEMTFNEIWAQMLGYSLAELVPTSLKTWEMLIHPNDVIRAGELFAHHFMGKLLYYECELRMKHKDGHWVWIQDRGQVITRTEDNKPLLMLGTHTDISARKAAEEKIRLLNTELENLTLTDFLTNLFNRRYFMLRGTEAVKRVMRNKEPLSLLMLDIDWFKKVNDDYGHEVGDWALQHVAGVLKSSLREIDILARIGGEEFAVLLPNMGQDEAAVLAERVRKLIQDTPFETGGEAIPITISLGAAVFENGMADIDDLLRNADAALYEAKHSGRNRVVIFQDNLPPAEVK